MMTLLSDAPSSRMKTALSEPVSASLSQLCPRSYSLLPPSKDLPFAIVLGEERWTMLPERVGMLRDWAETMASKLAMKAELRGFIVIVGQEVV